MRINLLFLLPSVFIVFGCDSNNENTPEDKPIDSSLVDTASVFIPEDSARTIVNLPSLWEIEFQEDGGKEKLKAPTDSVLTTLTADQLIQALNTNYPEVQLQFKAISQDTMYVSIPNSEYLANQMGSTGAYNYMATAVFNLTELKNIQYIRFDFKGGSHADPGVFSRGDFDRLR